MTTRHNTAPLLILVVALATVAVTPAQTQDGSAMMLNQQPGPARSRIDWKRLNLNKQQDEQIQLLEHDWNGKYCKVMPQIKHQQHRLQDLFRNPHADPLEIVATQQSISRMQEQLRSEAMANYLRKRALLNDMQQRQLEAQLHQMIMDRQQQRSAVQTSAPEEQSGGLMSIIQKVRWAIEPH